MLLSPDWKVVWVRTLDGVSAIDAASHKYLTHIATGNAKSPFGGPGAFSGMASVSPDAGRPNLLYVANPKDNSVTAIDADRRAAVATIPVGTEPRAMAYSSFSGKVYVLNARSRDVSVIDPSAQKVVKTIAVPQSGLGAIGFMHNGRFATIDSRHARGGGDSLVVISAETDSVVGTITLHSEGTPTPDPVNPSRVYFTPDDKLGFAIHKTSPHLSVVDVEKLKLVKLIKLEPRNKDVYYRCSVLVAQDGKTVYLTSGSDQTLTAVDVASLTVRAVIDTKAPTCAVYNFRTAGSPH